MDASLSWLHRTFDDPNLVSCAGLAAVLRLAERAGLQEFGRRSGAHEPSVARPRCTSLGRFQAMAS